MEIYAYVDDNKNLFFAFSKDEIPNTFLSKRIEIDSLDYLKYVKYDAEQNEIIYQRPTTEQLLDERKEEVISNLKKSIKSYFEKTDYVIMKIYEAKIMGDEDLENELRERYSSVLQERYNVRDEYEELLERVRNARSRSELASLETRVNTFIERINS